MSFNTKSYDLMKQLVDSEKESAISSYGAIYNSNHEGYAVLLEEIEETEHELSEIKNICSRYGKTSNMMKKLLLQIWFLLHLHLNH